MCLTREKLIRKELTISQSEEFLESHNKMMRSEEAKLMLKNRAAKIEPLIGHITDDKQLTFQRFTLKGIDNIAIEAVLLALCVSIKQGRFKNQGIFFFYICFIQVKII